MTPLEEIEKALNDLLSRKGTETILDVAYSETLGTLYTARAIERLEATVRAIGVHLERVRDEEQARRENRGQASRQHTFFNVNPEAAICQICGYARPAGIHYPEDRKDNG